MSFCRRLLLSLLLLVGLLASAPSRSEAQLGQPSATEQQASGGVIEWVRGFQREANRQIGQQLRAIKDGQSMAPLLMGLLLAFTYGVVHATGPGHGKLVIMGYFLGREANIPRGLWMGAQIAAMHVVSAVVIVVAADFLLRRGFGGTPAEIPAVRAASYALIFAIGLWMLNRALQGMRGATTAQRHHEHAHDHAHHHDEGCGCSHVAKPGESRLLSIGVGLVPCTGSLLIMLYAVANGMVGIGLALVSMIALGMAVTMSAIGLASVWSRRLVLQTRAGGSILAIRTLEVGGAVLVSAVGLVLLTTAV